MEHPPARLSRYPAWLLPAGLLLLLAVPMAAGLVRLASLAVQSAPTPENARFLENPLPIVVHILAVLVYGVLGAFQVTPAFRKHNLARHRAIGRWALPAAFLSALSGLWLTHVYPAAADDGPGLTAIRWVVGGAMLAFLILGAVALWRRSFVAHGAWMLRAYALGMGAGTQFFTHIAWILLVGKPSGWTRDSLLAAGWILNALLAEWILLRLRKSRRGKLPLSPRPGEASRPQGEPHAAHGHLPSHG
jgi:hypothetical protein